MLCMNIPHFLTISEQVAAYLREELIQERWSGDMPGMNSLAVELGVNSKTADAALRLLEKEGLLVPQGAGKRRKILLPDQLATAKPALKVAILDYEPLEQTEVWAVAMRQQLLSQGHNAFFTQKSLLELRMDVNRIAALVKKTPADAWVIKSGPLEVLTWFSQQETPAFALFGRRRGLPIAGVGPDQVMAGCTAARRLIQRGHQRIAVIVREDRHAGGVGSPERAIFKEMEAHGIPTGSYNLPRWKDHSEGLHQMLEELFRVTPPTAMIIDEPFLFHAVKEHLAQRGILAPAQVSLICADPDPTFAWCEPSVAHIRWDSRPVVNRVLSWVGNIAQGKDDLSQTLTKAEFIDGGTVGAVPE